MAAPVRKRRFPIVGDGGGVWSHVHIEDGAAATAMTTDVRRASNEKAERELGWQPRYASWRQGFAEGLG